MRGSGRGEPRSGGCIVGTGAVLADQRSGWRRVPRSGKSCSAPCETGRSWRDLQCTWNRAQASCGFACGCRLYTTVQAKLNSRGHKKSPAPRGSVRGSWAWKPEKPLEAVRGRDAVPVKSMPRRWTRFRSLEEKPRPSGRGFRSGPSVWVPRLEAIQFTDRSDASTFPLTTDIKLQRVHIRAEKLRIERPMWGFPGRGRWFESNPRLRT